MPELPEVETVARLIAPRLLGRTITAARVAWKKSAGGKGTAQFTALLAGARFARVFRRAKYIVFELERGGAPAGALLGHLRMTGRMHVEPAAWDPGPYAKIALCLDDGAVFHFIDVRKFGRLVYCRHPQELLEPLGPEPLGPEFDVAWLARALRAKRARLKPLLLDQSFLAGLGNIYVDEALHRARLHPLLASQRLRPEQVERLHGAIQSVLRAAIERDGSSFDTFYRTPTGEPGAYQEEFQVYGRTGKACQTCAAPIRRIVVGQRGTHFCPRCQRPPRPQRTARIGRSGRSARKGPGGRVTRR